MCRVEWVLTQLNRFRRFSVGGRRYRYFIHEYNEAWANERTVEVPVVQSLLTRALTKRLRVLEVGNVLSHYMPVQWPVVDKYEQGAGVVNQDILDYCPAEKFDLLVSISTFEHVGFDETGPREGCRYDAEKLKKVIVHVRDHILKPDGTLFLTIPAGYNPGLDALVLSGEIHFDGLFFMKRMSRFNEWREVKAGDIQGARYHDPYYCANAVYFAWIGNEEKRIEHG